MPDDSVEKVPPPCAATDGKVFSISSQNLQESSGPEVPDVAHLSLEKLRPCLPLDLSRGLEVTAPLPPAPSYHNECPRAEKEDTQTLTNPSSKAVADGRGAPAAPGILKTEKKVKLEDKSSTALGMNGKYSLSTDGGWLGSGRTWSAPSCFPGGAALQARGSWKAHPSVPFAFLSWSFGLSLRAVCF
ncbi:PHD finger protein 20 like 1 [Phyllostomus discolor]|nr:PHD finger protein 20 like 1 [Phyllostomus discolor]